MFEKLLENNFSNQLKTDAEKYIILERNRFKDIIDFVLNYCAENKLLISNIDLLLNRHKYWDFIDVYALNVEETAQLLTKDLCNKFENKFLLKLDDINNEYIIEYDLRKIILINAINPYKNFTLYDFISPIKYTNFYLFPPFLEIIYLYKNLYDPNKAADWITIYDDIKFLEKLEDIEIEGFLNKDVKDLEKLISSSRPIKAGAVCKIDEYKLIMQFIKENNYILVGDAAYSILNNTSSNEVPEVISRNNIKTDIKILLNFLEKVAPRGLSFKKKTLYIPKENSMECYKIYLNNCNKQKHILTIYNNMTYELINYDIKNGYKLADPIVLTRFVYISIWLFIISQRTRGLQYSKFKELIKNKKTQLDFLRKLIDIYTLKENYEGSYLDPILRKKILAAQNITPKKKSYYCHSYSSSDSIS